MSEAKKFALFDIGNQTTLEIVPIKTTLGR